MSSAAEILLRGDFYVTGGTLRPDAPSYVERQADKDLCQGLLQGEFCYVLTSRQMGKSSLMVRTVKRLREEGVAVAVLDLTAIGQNLTIEQWYDGLISRLGQQLKLEDELQAFWESHSELGPLQRWTSALEQVVLKQLSSEVVIFVDEIDIVRSLPFSTDEFFAAIRECYNRRAHEPAFNRLAFGLLGVATPNDLIRDTRMTPFNIGRRIELNDFTAQEAAPLAAGLGGDPQTARNLLARVLYWSGGHPYLTQRLCRALADQLFGQANDTESKPLPPKLLTIQDVDQAAEKLFLSRQARDRDDNLIFVRERILRSEVDVAGLLYLYRKVLYGDLVADNETNPLVSILHLSGIARGVNGYLQVRNRIYRHVFDLTWVLTNMPHAEVRRQRRAGRKGMFIGFAAAGVLLVSYLIFGPVYRSYREGTLAEKSVQRLEKVYSELGGYRDAFETRMELGLGGSTVPVTGTGSLVYDAPDRINLAIKSALNSPETEVRFLRAGPVCALYAPSSNEYQPFGMSPPGEGPVIPGWLNQQVGPVALLPVYRLLLDPAVVRSLAKNARNILPAGYAEVEGQPVRVVEWEQHARPFLSHIGIDLVVSEDATIPVTAWINTSNNFVVQLRMDLSNWARDLTGQSPDVPITGLVITELHKSIQAKPYLLLRPGPPHLDLPSDARRVERLQLPPVNFASLNAPRREIARLIPARLPSTPTNLVDLSEFYNAAFAQTWHPGVENNTLDMLPPGLLQLGGTVFDVRGIVQLSGKRLQNAGGRFPQQINGIRVGQSCRQLHFLQGAGWAARDGTKIASYVVHFADGKEDTIPVVYGEDVRDWNAGGDLSTKLTRGRIVWRAVNDAHFSVRLFKTTWINPSEGSEVASIDYISSMSDAAPFLLAITAEK